MKKVITRFAPSPTGYVHIGGLRTALFSFLWARKHSGSFRIRIEDTDQKREVPGATDSIIRTLTQLGLAPDGEIIIQSQRAREGIYKRVAQQLIARGHAYCCFCSSEALDAMREEQNRRKQPPGYDGRCRKIEPSEAAARAARGERHTVRLSMQDAATTFHDELHGDVVFDRETLHDPIILKSDGYPTYHLANVVDDHDMGVTQVIRGEEWLPSAPIHVTLYEKLDFRPPKFYHLPLIMNADRTKLSKRRNDVAVESYLAQGYLKESLINYIVFLGWNPGGEREMFSLEELIAAFDLAHLNASSAIFSIEKLNWYNSLYIRTSLAARPKSEIIEVLKPFLPHHSDEKRLQIFETFYERIYKLSQLTELAETVSVIPPYDASLLIFAKSNREKTLQGIRAALGALAAFDKEWTRVNLDIALKETTASRGLSFGDLMWPVRVALSGQKASPPPAQIMELLGPDESRLRIETALKKLER